MGGGDFNAKVGMENIFIPKLGIKVCHPTKDCDRWNTASIQKYMQRNMEIMDMIIVNQTDHVPTDGKNLLEEVMLILIITF